ncbi:rhomboid family intramembrane serine protease [Sphingorhabdus sp.]|uniref:rhomboid family intramembrane serine protease n=1 Tax=Sphingorhabdus sp. TaxID=1902408 RepID=UPI00391CEA9F
MIQHWKAIAGLSAAMVAVHVVNFFSGGYLSTFGIEPREISSAYSIATAPWLHTDVGHLGSNLAAFVVLGSLVLLQGLRYFVKASALIILLGGTLVWLFARDATHIGASGWVFGLWSLVIALAWFDRSPRNIAIALAVVFFYGGMVFGVLPTAGYISFESHLFGAIAGVFAAFTLSKKPVVEIVAPARQNELKFWS